MLAAPRRAWNYLTEHVLLAVMALALMALTIGGVGSSRSVGIVGLVLCLSGFAAEPARVDLWAFIPMLVYELINAVSTYVTYGNVTEGYFVAQAVYPVLYLLLARLGERDALTLRRLCALWTGVVAVHGLAQFVRAALEGNAARLSGLLGNPNALGSFLMVGWFALTAFPPEADEKGIFAAVLRRLEPLILAALTLTLSMGSFLALAIGMAVRICGVARTDGAKAAVQFACRMLARAALCFGAGVLLYCTGRLTEIPWFCLVLLAWLAALCLCWPRMDAFFTAFQWVAPLLTACGAAVAAVAVYIRPSATATFTQRLQMMRNGLSYILVNPLLGVGPYQWRLLNLADSDTYYNTWHIHNVLIHIGVELGLIALAAALIIIIRRYRKVGVGTAGFTAFFCHNLMDTSFFYTGTTAMVLCTTADPKERGRVLKGTAVNVLLGAFALLFAYSAIFAPVVT